MTSHLLYYLLPNEVEVSLYRDASGNDFINLVRREYIFSVALKVEVLPRRKILASDAKSENRCFALASYVKSFAVNDVVSLRG